MENPYAYSLRLTISRNGCIVYVFMLQRMRVSCERQNPSRNQHYASTLLSWNVAYLEHVWEEEQETRVHASTQAH